MMGMTDKLKVRSMTERMQKKKKIQERRAWQKPDVQLPFSEAFLLYRYLSFSNYSHLLWAVKVFLFLFSRFAWRINKQVQPTY